MTCRNHSTRDRILAAAEKLFAEKGYKETTTREIVREAGASLSSLQSHFQGKESVYFQVRCKAIEELYQFMRPSMEEVEYMDSQGLLYGETACCMSFCPNTWSGALTSKTGTPSP